MKKQKQRNLDFVAAHYKRGALDTRRAYAKVRAQLGLVARPMWPRYVAAASVALLVGVGAWLYATRTVTLGSASATVAEVFTLPDGSHVTLAPGSRLSYKANHPRRIDIEGKAYIAVAHTPGEPFAVVDPRYEVADIGTRFVVDERHGATVVYVDEGEVYFKAAARGETAGREVSGAAGRRAPRSTSAAHGLRLAAGQGATLAAGASAPVAMARVSGAIATWATGTFHFSNTPLPDVLRDLSAYYGVSLSAPDNGRRLTADIDATSLSEVTAIVEETLGVKIARR